MELKVQSKSKIIFLPKERHFVDYDTYKTSFVYKEVHYLQPSGDTRVVRSDRECVCVRVHTEYFPVPSRPGHSLRLRLVGDPVSRTQGHLSSVLWKPGSPVSGAFTWWLSPLLRTLALTPQSSEDSRVIFVKGGIKGQK